MGRTALLARLDQLLIEEPADCWVVVTGGPGMGKSALLAAWLARREAAGESVPHHFIRLGDDPAKLVGSLVAQIVARFPAQAEPEAAAQMHPAARLRRPPERRPWATLRPASRSTRANLGANAADRALRSPVIGWREPVTSGSRTGRFPRPKHAWARVPAGAGTRRAEVAGLEIDYDAAGGSER